MAYTTIKKPSDYFNTKLYTGTAGGQTISGVGHQPDFIWVKQRGDAGYDHSLHNSVSGLLKQLISNSTSAEITNTDTVTSNNADGFVLGADTAGPNANSNNQDTKNYVAWNWKANGAGSANTDGTISSTVSANTTSGFSIVSYTGTGSDATVGHGLGSTPKMIIFKRRDSATNWSVQSTIWGDQKELNLNTTGALSLTDSRLSIQSTWTNTLFNVKTYGDQNASGGTFIAYCFADVQGFSKFGSYTGNGNADGTFVYTGFKPAFIMVKRTNTTGAWGMYDNKRDSFNVVDLGLAADLSSAEDFTTNDESDFLSNGFKLRSTGGSMNASGSTYIYMAFAEQPLVGDNPATAR